MVAADFKIGGIDLGLGAPKQNVFSRGFEEIVVDLQRANGVVPVTAAHGRGVGAGARLRDTMKAAEIRIDDGNKVGTVDHSDALVHFPVVRRMKPVAVENDVVSTFR